MKILSLVTIALVVLSCASDVRAQGSEAGAEGAAAAAPAAEAGAPAPVSGDVGGSDAGAPSLPNPPDLGAAPGAAAAPGTGELSAPVHLPPYKQMTADNVVSPNVQPIPTDGYKTDLAKRIGETQELLNRMVWQLNRETAWANSVHDIIQNYQYKYTKVLSNIKKHAGATQKMRELVSNLKKARLHEILESDFSKAIGELQELATTSSETSQDDGSYAALKDRVALMAQDLSKMSHKKINKVIHQAQDQLKSAEQQAVPPPSADTLKSLK
eukprot:TRINITY_DN65790_c11_g4_i1.p1 TRINITY_DN65790_c11_g4~~TRINITY_DN65790_c11_g4_i1.p1  ORF type:complete len:295 (-),score=140.86 TRINITY_DN65790_c11_g4_i1:235-1044(-)